MPLAWPPPAPGATGGLGCPLRAALPAASTGPGPSPQLQAIAPHLPLSSLSAITFLVSFTRCSNADCLSYARIFIYFRSFQQQVRLIATDCKQASLAQTDLLSVIKVNTKHTHLLQLLPDKPLARSPLSTIQPPPPKEGRAGFPPCSSSTETAEPPVSLEAGCPCQEHCHHPLPPGVFCQVPADTLLLLRSGPDGSPAGRRSSSHGNAHAEGRLRHRDQSSRASTTIPPAPPALGFLLREGGEKPAVHPALPGTLQTAAGSSQLTERLEAAGEKQGSPAPVMPYLWAWRPQWRWELSWQCRRRPGETGRT